MKAMSPTSRVEFRLAPELKLEIEEAAALLGSSFTAFATSVLVERAREIKREHQLSVLSGEAGRSFVELMADPPEPSEALVKTLNTRKVAL